jgi:hypothetical protein
MLRSCIILRAEFSVDNVVGLSEIAYLLALQLPCNVLVKDDVSRGEVLYHISNYADLRLNVGVEAYTAPTFELVSDKLQVVLVNRFGRSGFGFAPKELVINF